MHQSGIKHLFVAVFITLQGNHINIYATASVCNMLGKSQVSDELLLKSRICERYCEWEEVCTTI